MAVQFGRRTPAFRLLTGDDIIRQVPFAQRLSRAEELFDLTLATIHERLAANNVIIDGAWSEAQILEAQRRFAGAGMFIVLRYYGGGAKAPGSPPAGPAAGVLGPRLARHAGT